MTITKPTIVLDESARVVTAVVDGTPFTVTGGESFVTVTRPDTTVYGTPAVRVVANIFMDPDGNARVNIDLTAWPAGEHARLVTEIAVALNGVLRSSASDFSATAQHIIRHFIPSLQNLGSQL